MRLLVLSLIFISFYGFAGVRNQYPLTVTLDQKSIHDHIIVTITDQNETNIVNNKKLEKATPLKLTLTSPGPYHLTYLATPNKTIDKHHTKGLGEMNVHASGSTYDICIDDESSPRCPKAIILRDPEWPGVTITGVHKE